MNSKKLATTALFILSFSAASYQALAKTSANFALVSQYHFRGIQQTTSASASAGIDYEQDALSVGVWATDVKDGLEVDLYASYGFELESGITFGLGATSYQFTGDFDSAYNEVNLSAGFNMFSLGYYLGQWDGEVDNEKATEADYSVLTIGLEHKGFSGELGIYGHDFDGEYLDINYSSTIGEFDVSIGLIISGSDLDDDESMYLSFGKTFDL